MRFLYVIKTTNTNNLVESSGQEFLKGDVIFGRGGRADVLLDSRTISLEHARFIVEGSQLVVEDLGSLGGVRVNEGAVTRQVLRVGDVVTLGEVKLKVIQDGGTWGVLEERRPKLNVEEIAKRQAAELSVMKRLPSLRIVGALFVLLIVVAFWVAPLLGVGKRSWNSGPISNNHGMINTDCNACHASPFTQVRDEQCLACHKLTEHNRAMPSIVEKHPHLGMRCAQCHMEHNGDHGLITKDSRLCVDCHGGMSKYHPESKYVDVGSFAKHPEFSVSVLRFDPQTDKPTVDRVRLDDKEKLTDNSRIKLNHKIHLEPNIRGANGPVTLTCTDCHELSLDIKKVQPISHDKHCASCHPREFDDRLPGNQVPHAAPDVVYNYMYAEYAKYLLRTEGQAPPSAPVMPAGIPRLRPGANVENKPPVDFARGEVESETRKAERQLFTKTACQLCHEVGYSSAPEMENGVPHSKYSIKKPYIFKRWYVGSEFNHAAHEEVTCESCHRGVNQSERTSDVLLPGIADCRVCHHEPTKPGFATSECVMCHSFHEPLTMPNEKKRPLEQIVVDLNQRK